MAGRCVQPAVVATARESVDVRVALSHSMTAAAVMLCDDRTERLTELAGPASELLRAVP